MTHHHARIMGGATAGLMLLAACLPATAQTAPPPSPVDVVRERNQAVQEILDASGDSVDAATREELKDVINGLIDFRELSRRALARYWDDRTKQEKSEFVDVFRQLVRNSSVRKLGIYRADSVVYLEPEISGDEAEVTTVAYKDRKDVEIVYRMHLTDGEWKAYDVVIDDASTVRTYRDSFSREISRTSYSAMYDRLVQKLEEEGSGGAGTSTSSAPDGGGMDVRTAPAR